MSIVINRSGGRDCPNRISPRDTYQLVHVITLDIGILQIYTDEILFYLATEMYLKYRVTYRHLYLGGAVVIAIVLIAFPQRNQLVPTL